MDIKNFVKRIVNNFLVIYTVLMFGQLILWHFNGTTHISWQDLTFLFMMSILFSLAGFIFYSKRNLKRLELLIRHVFHFILIIAIYLSVGSYFGVVPWNEPRHLVTIAALTLGVYIAVSAIRLYQTKRQTDEMNEMLKEINKK